MPPGTEQQRETRVANFNFYRLNGARSNLEKILYSRKAPVCEEAALHLKWAIYTIELTIKALKEDNYGKRN